MQLIKSVKPYTYLFHFISALIPRLIDPRITLNVDFTPWYFRSLNFLIALRYFDFGETFQSAHPGVTLMWLSALSLKIVNYLPEFDLIFPHYNFTASKII